MTQLAFPSARGSDPSTSHEAAQAIKAGNEDLVFWIRAVVTELGEATQEQIADRVERLWPGRWTHGSIVSGCARARLTQGGTIRNSRGRNVHLWTLTDSNFAADGAEGNVSTSPEDRRHLSMLRPSPSVPGAAADG